MSATIARRAGISNRRAATGGLLYRLTKLRVLSPEAKAERTRYRRALAELNAMSVSELAELGIFHNDVPRVAREMAHRH